MALVLADRVQETTTTTGTTDFALGGAVTGFQTFTAGIGNSNTCYYAALLPNSSEWEVGLGTLSSDGLTLARTTVYSSSTGSKVSFSSGQKFVFVTYPSEKSVNLDATGNVSALGTVSSGAWQGSTIGVAYGGTGVTTSTGSGSVVLSNSPALTTPDLGTPSAVNLTNGTALPLTTGVSGVLPTANGGTNLSSFTSGGVVYASSTSALTTGSALTFDGTQLKSTAAGGFGVLTNSSDAGTTAGAGAGFAFQAAGSYKGIFGARAYVIGAGTDQSVMLQSYADDIYFNPASGKSVITQIGSAEQMRLTSTGLGIGTSSPGYKLDVVGGGRFYSANYTDNVVRLATNSLTTGNINQILFADQLTNTTASITAYNTAYGSGLNGALRFATASGTATLDSSGNLGLGVTTSAWNSGSKALELNAAAFSGYSNSEAQMSQNAYLGASGWVYKNSYYAMLYTQSTGQHRWYTAPSGTAGNAISFTQAMTLDASGNLGIGGTPVSQASTTAFTVYNSANSLIYLQNSTSGTGTTDGFTLALAGSDAYINNREAGNILFYVNGSERMRIDSSGNVGIGTSSPGNKLHVNGDLRTQGNFFLANSTGQKIYPYYGSTTNHNYIGAESDGSISFGTGTSSPTERMRIDAVGNVVLKTGSLQEVKTAIAASAIDLSTGNYFTKTISGATTFTVSNVPTTGTAISFILDLTNGGSATITWWSGMKWAGGTAPTLTASGRDSLGFYTYDGGTTWTGLVLGKDIK